MRVRTRLDAIATTNRMRTPFGWEGKAELPSSDSEMSGKFGVSLK